MKSIYLHQVIKEVPRILSNQDRDPLSPSYGSFDRRYWGWKFKDFSDATLQCSIGPLLQIWSIKDSGNPYYNNDCLFEWITAGANYLCNIQRADGSFDQCYPNEKAVGNIYEIFEPFARFIEKAKGKLPDDKIELYRDCIRRACEFSLKHEENHGNIANHFALYSYVSYKMGQFLHDERYQIKGERLLNRVLDLQSEEGWFQEYGGADPGYETRTLYYLAKLATEFPQKGLMDSISCSLKNFLVYCVHPDGSLGGEYGSRNTMICYPAGLEALAKRIPEAAAIVLQVRKHIQGNSGVSLSSLDFDNLIRLAANYMEAHRFAETELHTFFRLPFEMTDGEYSLNKAGLYFKSTPNYYFILNFHKGGVFKIYDKKTTKLLHSDTSYGAIRTDDAVLSTNLLVRTSPVQTGNGTILIKTNFYKVLLENMTTCQMVGLRVAAMTFLRLDFLADLFRRYISRRLFARRKRHRLLLTRRIILDTDSIHIDDQITNTASIKRILWTANSTAVHMASSKYFSLSQLSRGDSVMILQEGDISPHNAVNISTEIALSDQCWSVKTITNGE